MSIAHSRARTLLPLTAGATEGVPAGQPHSPATWRCAERSDQLKLFTLGALQHPEQHIRGGTVLTVRRVKPLRAAADDPVVGREPRGLGIQYLLAAVLA
jgi:hypothetical protein